MAGPFECMPLPRDQNIHAHAQLRQLRRVQGRVLAPLLQRETGQHALRIGVADGDGLPSLPGMVWTRLWLTADSYRGDLQGSTAEALPFVDEAFDVLWLQHALEPAGRPEALLAEARRVLSAGGLLVVSSLHPCSAWMPWYCWHARGQGQALHWPWRLRQRLTQAGFAVEGLRRVGARWPGAHRRDDDHWGGAYLLLARKPRRQAIPLKLRPLPTRGPVNASLSPGTRRQGVSRTGNPV